MRNCPVQFSLSRTCGALIARSFKFSTFSRSSGCSVLARGKVGLRTHLERNDPTFFSIRAFLSGYRGLASVLQNSPDRMPDVLQALSPVFVTSQALHVLKRSEGVTHELGSFIHERGFFSQGEACV